MFNFSEKELILEAKNSNVTTKDAVKFAEKAKEDIKKALKKEFGDKIDDKKVNELVEKGFKDVKRTLNSTDDVAEAIKKMNKIEFGFKTNLAALLTILVQYAFVGVTTTLSLIFPSTAIVSLPLSFAGIIILALLGPSYAYLVSNKIVNGVKDFFKKIKNSIKSLFRVKKKVSEEHEKIKSFLEFIKEDEITKAEDLANEILKERIVKDIEVMKVEVANKLFSS